ncbi:MULTISPECIES: hypothetical protein [unclassified Streptomyces]|uniref:hypothetical protein n=1 Tax=unclassified Streptomyces TaxID=2593676 RepID=UPI000361895B|nr:MULTISPECIES: hypothetical protein [unclassified Streptomyces]EYT82009.1 hypothetical protein CF54_16030 [Streptomyces sp. Tu 6176]
MNPARVLKSLAAGAALTAAALAVPTATAAAAPADCSYSSVTRSNVELYGHVGYVELMYSSGCHSTEAHFHVDSSFLANHSGWNVTLWVGNGRKSDSNSQSVVVTTPYPNNTSYADYWSAPIGIYGQPTEQFVAGVTWTYNACHGEWGSGWHDYTNGYNYGDGGAYNYSQGCHG